MTHARIIKCQMLDWIKLCLEQDERMPTDDEIADRFNLNGVVSARTLLADLCDEGAIRVRWNQPGRPIELGPKERTPLVAAMPNLAMVRRAERDMDRAVSRIGGIIRRKRAIAEIVAEEAHESSSRRLAAASCGRTIYDGAKIKPLPAPVEMPAAASPPPAAVPVPAPAPDLDMKRLPTAPGRNYTRRKGTIATLAERKQINVHADATEHAQLVAIADAEGVSVSATARTLLLEALTARKNPVAPVSKPRVRAAVVKAWQADGRPFGEFISLMIDLGLHEYHRLHGTITAEAAE